MTHPFEIAGLGKAPFRFAGCEDTAAGVNSMGLRRIGSMDGFDVHTTPGGTCAYCGKAIIILCNVVSSDSKRFHVGSDCINKISAEDRQLASATKRAVNKRNKARRDARNTARIKAAVEALPTVRADLEAQHHPRARMAERGLTLADWADWMLENAGTKGRLEVAKVVESAIKAA